MGINNRMDPSSDSAEGKMNKYIRNEPFVRD
jgi:hypothetical protein